LVGFKLSNLLSYTNKTASWYAGFIDELNQLFSQIDAGNLKAFTSELTLAEVLVRPLMDGNLEIQSVYQQASL